MHHSKIGRRWQTSRSAPRMSAVTPTADIAQRHRHVRLVPIAVICDHVIGKNPLNRREPTYATHLDPRLTTLEVPAAKMREGAADFLVDRADACQSPCTTPDADLLWYQRAAPSWNGKMVLRVKFAGTVSAAAWWICIISSWFAKTASAMA